MSEHWNADVVIVGDLQGPTWVETMQAEAMFSF